MEASKARELSIKNQYKSLDEISEYIFSRATDGYRHLIVEDKLSDYIMIELNKLGYKFEQFKKQDEYFIKIIW
jgi:hypothetical protein